jgi:hypothetical protein
MRDPDLEGPVFIPTTLFRFSLCSLFTCYSFLESLILKVAVRVLRADFLFRSGLLSYITN